MVAAAKAVPGVDSVAPYTGLPPIPGVPAGPPKVVDGLVRLDATLDRGGRLARGGRPPSRACATAVRAVPGADAKVGGFSAINLDVQNTSQRDRTVIIPLVLLVVFIILSLLLRSLIAPLLLVLTVLLSFFATLGVSGVVFRDVFGFAGADSSFPLFAFVFLVALGVDYNIFLMTRVREEVAEARAPGRHPGRTGRHRRRDHLGRGGAGGDLLRPGGAAAGVPGRDSPSRSRSACCSTPWSCGPCWCPR